MGIRHGYIRRRRRSDQISVPVFDRRFSTSDTVVAFIQRSAARKRTLSTRTPSPPERLRARRRTRFVLPSVGCHDDELAVGFADHAPTVVHHSMVTSAKQDEIAKVGEAVLRPMHAVVNLAVPRSHVAAGEPATSIAMHCGAALGGVGGARSATDIQRL